MKFNIRLLYLYLFSFVGLLITVIGAVRLVDIGLKATFFKDADIYEYAQPRVVECVEGENCPEELSAEDKEQYARDQAVKNRQRDLSSSMSMIIVGLPLYLYHWGVIKKEKKQSG